MTRQGTASTVGLAIGQAAVGLGLPNPMTTADELLRVDVDALHEWFTAAGHLQVLLWQGSDRIADALPMLAAGWSSSAPRSMISRQRDAALAGRDVVTTQLGAADNAVATLRQSRVLADAELSTAESAVLGLGWPPEENLLDWAIFNGAFGPLAGIVGTLHERLAALMAHNTDALSVLADALRADPGDRIEQLVAARPDAVAAPAIGGSITSGPAPGVDAANLARLTADLQSNDPATLAMALGVSEALDKAAQEGGVGQLLVYESANATSQGRAAISVGDVSTADNVAVFAPGISSAPVTMSQGISSAAAIRNESQRQAPGDRTAVVSWYGYDIPLSALGGVPVTNAAAAANLLSALDDGAAREGGSLLVQDMTQFRTWAPETARFIGMGFSMGSTTVSAAAAQGAAFDDVILLGSPGASSDVESADDYPQMTAQHVHVLSYDNDPVTRRETDVLADLVGSAPKYSVTGEPFGPDPSTQDFGAQVIDTTSNNVDVSLSINSGMVGGWIPDTVTEVLGNEALDLMSHHQEGNYLSGASLAAVAAVVNGRYSEVPIKPGR